MPKPKSPNKPPKHAEAFSLFSETRSWSGAIGETLDRATWMDKRTIIPIPEFPMAWLLNSRGFVEGSTIDIMGGDGLGKTTLMLTMMGWFMRHNSPCKIIGTERKPMVSDRIMQCLHTDKRLAELMYTNGLSQDECYSFLELVEKIGEFVKECREGDERTRVPKHIPIVVGVDTLSKVMTPTENAYLSAYGFTVPVADEDETTGDGKKKAKIKELGGGSNMEFAKMVHAWCRLLPSILSQGNVILITGRHQNDKLEMAKGPIGGGKLMTEEVKDSFNRTSRGGRGINQNAAYQIILSPSKPERASINGTVVKVGQWIKASVAKNSYGRPRTLEYLLNFETPNETENYIDPALDFDRALPAVLMQTGLLKVTAPKLNSFICKDLGIENQPARELAKAFYAQPELVESMMQRLKFVGHQPEFVIPESAIPGAEPEPEKPEEAAEETPEPPLLKPSKPKKPAAPKPPVEEPAV